MGDKSFLVKVKMVGAPGWSGSPIHLFADSHIEAEKEAKRIYARHMGTNVGNIDAKAVREDAKTVWKRRGKP